jgi:MFS family permease
MTQRVTPPGRRAGPPAPTLRDYLGVSLFWLALSFFWGAMLVMVLPFRAEELFGRDGKDAALARLLSTGAAVAAVTQVLSGALSDAVGFRWGRRRPYMLAGTVAATAALLLFPSAESMAQLLACYVAIQFLLNIAIGPYQALIPDLIPLAHHGRASAFMGVWALLGRIGGPAVAAVLLARPEGLSQVIIVFAVLLNGFMVVNLALIREPPSGGRTAGFRDTLRRMLQIPLRPYPGFVWILISRFGIMMGLYTVMFCLLYYVRYSLGVGGEAESLAVVRNFMVLSTLTGLAGAVAGGMISDRIRKVRVLYVSNSVCVAAGLAFLMVPDVSAAYWAVALFGVGMGAFQSVDWALGCNLLPEHAPAKYLGVWGMSDTIPQVIAPLIAGPVAIAFNRPDEPGLGYRVLMVVAMVYFILGTVALSRIRERTPQGMRG